VFVRICGGFEMGEEFSRKGRSDLEGGGDSQEVRERPGNQKPPNSPVDREIETHEFGELLVVIAQHASEVGGPIELWVDGSNALAVTVGVTVDGGSDDWQFGDQVHAVFVDVFPVLALVDALTLRDKIRKQFERCGTSLTSE
jgi:hypothetical protein